MCSREERKIVIAVIDLAVETDRIELHAESEREVFLIVLEFISPSEREHVAEYVLGAEIILLIGVVETRDLQRRHELHIGLLQHVHKDAEAKRRGKRVRLVDEFHILADVREGNADVALKDRNIIEGSYVECKG